MQLPQLVPPPDVINKLNAAFVAALKNPEIRARLLAQAAEPVGNSLTEFAAFIKFETEKWSKTVKDSGASVD